MPRCFDEMTLADGATRAVYGKVARWLTDTPSELLASRRAQAELLFRRIGITFAVLWRQGRGGAADPLRYRAARASAALNGRGSKQGWYNA